MLNYAFIAADIPEQNVCLPIYFHLIHDWIFQQVGLHPTAEQIELFAYHLPKATLSNLIVSTLFKLFYCQLNITFFFILF